MDTGVLVKYLYHAKTLMKSRLLPFVLENRRHSHLFQCRSIGNSFEPIRWCIKQLQSSKLLLEDITNYRKGF